MKKRWMRLPALLLAVLLTGCTAPEVITQGGKTVPTTMPTTTTTLQPQAPTVPTVTPDGYAVAPMQYPGAAVQTLEDRGLVLFSMVGRTVGEATYQGNRHFKGTNLIVSPYFTAQIDEVPLPVYATPVYVATDSHGALHSFASVDVAFGSRETVRLTLTVAESVSCETAQVFSDDPAVLTLQGKEIALDVSAHGVYTVVLDDDQDYAFTLFVRTYRDEEREIADYQARYGADHVRVFEPGIHEIDYLQIGSDSVLYLKAGAILLPRHTFDIQDDAAAASTSEPNASKSNGIGLNRFPVVNGYAGSNMVIAGRGTVDMTQLDWHERRGIVFTLCQNATMDGVIIVNPCEWAFITYRCENVSVTQSAVLGYRTNSDAFAICNSIDVQVTDCFARTGDDMFEVKTLGGVDTAVSRDITFRRCQAWGSKARCFGVIGEIEKDVSNILFEDGIVIFRDATWDNNRIGSLVVLRESGNGKVSGVTFRNMTIHYDAGRAIQVGVYGAHLTDSRMENIVFENVSYHAKMHSQIRINAGAGNVLRVALKNVTANGMLMTLRNYMEFFYCDQEGLLSILS